MEALLQDSAACVTVKVFPAMVNVPWRLVLALFAVTEYVTVPLPLPFLPDKILIQLALLAAVQLQPVCAVRATLPVPPVETNDWPVEESV